MEGSKNMATKTAISSNKKSTDESNSNTNTMGMTYKSFCKMVKKMPIVGVMIAEFIGTFLLVAAVFAVQGQPLYIAFVLVAIVLLIGNTSGAHVNPAMTIGAWITRKITGLYAIGYIIAQVAGAAVAYVTLNAFISSSPATTLMASPTLFHAAKIADNKQWMLFFAELLGTAILALGLAAAIRYKKANVNKAFTYGFAILIALLVAGWATSTSLTEANTTLSFLNPAIAIAANGISWNIWPIAIYILAPAIGAVIGFAIQDFLKSQTEEMVCDCDCCDTK